MGEENEQLTRMFSNISKELITMTHRYDELDKKFKQYYLKSDNYIKTREAKIEELETECTHLQEEYGRYDQMFHEESMKTKDLEMNLKKLFEEMKELKLLNHKQRLEIIDYEERYKGIDIAKMHEQMEYKDSQIEMMMMQ
jgi:chromosome segregation ATPase